MSGQMTHQIDSNLKKNLILAQVSMAIVFSFIVCHSIKWIPNIYEMLQVCKNMRVHCGTLSQVFCLVLLHSFLVLFNSGSVWDEARLVKMNSN